MIFVDLKFHWYFWTHIHPSNDKLVFYSLLVTVYTKIHERYILLFYIFISSSNTFFFLFPSDLWTKTLLLELKIFPHKLLYIQSTHYISLPLSKVIKYVICIRWIVSLITFSPFTFPSNDFNLLSYFSRSKQYPWFERGNKGFLTFEEWLMRPVLFLHGWEILVYICKNILIL